LISVSFFFVQVENLLLNKECFADAEVVGIIVDWMHSILGQNGTRTDANGLKVELVLTLVRNCLAMDFVPGPCKK
jgi:hypothetical protein